MSDTTAKKSGAALGITVHQESIVVAQNKNLELFVKNFHYESENVTAKHLGQVFGFFEIPEITDDNAYIVNFLASVVKKEYFQNPRRSANESFEAALHKVNLALTELVKQGNTSWLGKLEGAVAVIENDTCHFSVTGDAAIFLYRNQEATLISEGLADKDAATHPLKTFLEISSGKLLPGDTLLVSSPELFSLCSEELLLKNVSRMEGLAFARFVRTALVNELDLASSIIITIYEQEKPKSEPRRASLLEEASKINLQNVFSNSSFSSPLKSKNLGHKDSQDDAELQLNDGSEFSQTSSDYTDEKTGHIYVQGDTPEPNYQEPTRLRLALTEAWAAFTFTVHKNAKRWSKKSKRAALAGAEEFGNKASSLGVKSVHLTKKTSSQFVATSMAFMRSQKRRLKKKLARYQAARAIKKQTATLQSLNLTRIPQVTSSIFKETHITPQILPIQTDSSISPLEIPLSTIPFSDSSEISEISTDSRLAAFVTGRERATITKNNPHKSVFSLVEKILESGGSKMAKYSTKSTSFILKNRFLALGILLLVLSGSLFLFLKNAPQESVPLAPESPSTGASIAKLDENSTPPEPAPTAENILGQYEGKLVALLTTEETTYFIEKNAIRSQGAIWSQVDLGNFTLATYMKDLRLIFLWTDQNTLVSFSTVDKKFTKNNLPLASGSTVTGLGAYLTYLYVFDNRQGNIYRFPRTEGGFAEGSSWLKSPLPEKENLSFAVSDTIRIGGKTTKQYLKGNLEKTLSDEPHSLLVTSSNGSFVLGVATGTDKLTIWNADGGVVLTKSLPAVQSASHMSYDENAKKLYIAKEGRILSQDLSW